MPGDFDVGEQLMNLAQEHLELTESMGQPPWYMLRMEVTQETGEFTADFTYRDDDIGERLLMESPQDDDPF